MSKIVIYSDEDVTFSFEDAGDGKALLHCSVSNFSPSRLKRWYAVFSHSKRVMKANGFDKFITVSPNKKFCELFCGKHLGDYKDKYGVYEWELD